METDEDYIPFGKEWEKELMKLPKKFIIDMYRKVCINNQKKQSLIDEFKIILQIK